MPRRIAGARIARVAPFLITILVAAACTLSPRTPTPGPGSQVPSASPSLPTPVPTNPSTAAPPTDEPPAAVVLLVRLTSCSHACGPTPGTTILDDGRIIWEAIENRATESRLTPDALQRVTDAVAVPELDANGDYQAELRPGAEPAGRGATLYRLEVTRGGARVVVTFGDPAAYADEPDLWIIPPGMTTLAEIATELQNPVVWLGEASFAEDPHEYVADRYLVLIDLFPKVGDEPGFDVDVDDVRWPFAGPIEGAGDPVESAGGFGSRCLIMNADVAEALIAAEAAAGAHRQRHRWLSTVEYRWKRADGFVQVKMLPVLAHEHGSCIDLAAEVL
jgi:hypothetical protein